MSKTTTTASTTTAPDTALTVSDREREAYGVLAKALTTVSAKSAAAERAESALTLAKGAVLDSASDVWRARGNIAPATEQAPHGVWVETPGRPSFRALAIALIPNPKGWTGHAGANVSAAKMATMAPAEATYWRLVSSVAKALENAAKRAGRTTAGRTPGARSPQAPGKAPSAPAKAPEAPAPAPTPALLADTLEQVLAGGTGGLSKAKANSIRAIAKAKAEPVTPVSVPDLTDPATLAAALGAFVAAGQYSPTLAKMAREYLTKVTAPATPATAKASA